MYLSYCIKYDNGKHWTTVKVNQDKTMVINDHGVVMPIAIFLKYKHHFHDYEISEEYLNIL